MAEMSKTPCTTQREIENFRKGYLVLVSDTPFLDNLPTPYFPSTHFLWENSELPSPPSHFFFGKF